MQRVGDACVEINLNAIAQTQLRNLLATPRRALGVVGIYDQRTATKRRSTPGKFGVDQDAGRRVVLPRRLTRDVLHRPQIDAFPHGRY